MADTPERTYLVCATPRSGSTLLCETLRASGVAGRPLEHFEVLRETGLPPQPRWYFPGRVTAEVDALLAADEAGNPGDETPEAWWARVLELGTGAGDGVWGGKLMWGHVPDFLARVRELPGLADSDLDEALRALLGDGLRLVYVRREDQVAQAVSLWRAVQTQSWRAADGGTAGTASDDAQYAFSGIDRLVRLLEHDDAAWRRWFAETGREPLHVTFDELSADPTAAVARTLRFLGLPTDSVPAPATRRQGDDRNAEWIERYRADAARRDGERAAA